jgi:surfactin synthase thioesterase subunit
VTPAERLRDKLEYDLTELGILFNKFDIAESSRKPSAFFGHGLGALLRFEVGRNLSFSNHAPQWEDAEVSEPFNHGSNISTFGS